MKWSSYKHWIEKLFGSSGKQLKHFCLLIWIKHLKESGSKCGFVCVRADGLTKLLACLYCFVAGCGEMHPFNKDLGWRTERQMEKTRDMEKITWQEWQLLLNTDMLSFMKSERKMLRLRLPRTSPRTDNHGNRGTTNGKKGGASFWSGQKTHTRTDYKLWGWPVQRPDLRRCTV